MVFCVIIKKVYSYPRIKLQPPFDVLVFIEFSKLFTKVYNLLFCINQCHSKAQYLFEFVA